MDKIYFPTSLIRKNSKVGIVGESGCGTWLRFLLWTVVVEGGCGCGCRKWWQKVVAAMVTEVAYGKWLRKVVAKIGCGWWLCKVVAESD